MGSIASKVDFVLFFLNEKICRLRIIIIIINNID